MELGFDCKERAHVRRAAPAALCAAVLGTLFGAAAVQAAEAQGKAVLAGYSDGVAGESLVAGRYDAVIGILGARGVQFHSDEVAASTDLCVAYIMTRQWNAAHSACDEAIEVAKLDASDSTIYGRTAHAEEVALAYSNRAVLNWLSDRKLAAADDLIRAHALSPSSESVTENLATLRASGVTAASIAAAHG